MINSKDNKFIDRYNVDLDKYNIVYAGNIGHFQNVELLVKAAKILSNDTRIHFHIIGDGNRRDSIEKLINKENLANISLYPLQPRVIAPDVYSFGDVNVITLKKGVIETALPSKIPIVLACRKPIIGCFDKESHFAKLLESCDKTAICSPDDEKELAETIEYFCEKVSGYSKKAGKLFHSYFQRTANINQYIEVFNRLTKEDQNV
jgi:glycosyltransferase involved in cell wall biosynthesis